MKLPYENSNRQRVVSPAEGKLIQGSSIPPPTKASLVTEMNDSNSAGCRGPGSDLQSQPLSGTMGRIQKSIDDLKSYQPRLFPVLEHAHSDENSDCYIDQFDLIRIRDINDINDIFTYLHIKAAGIVDSRHASPINAAGAIGSRCTSPTSSAHGSPGTESPRVQSPTPLIERVPLRKSKPPLFTDVSLGRREDGDPRDERGRISYDNLLAQKKHRKEKKTVTRRNTRRGRGRNLSSGVYDQTKGYLGEGPPPGDDSKIKYFTCDIPGCGVAHFHRSGVELKGAARRVTEKAKKELADGKKQWKAVQAKDPVFKQCTRTKCGNHYHDEKQLSTIASKMTQAIADENVLDFGPTVDKKAPPVVKRPKANKPTPVHKPATDTKTKVTAVIKTKKTGAFSKLSSARSLAIKKQFLAHSDVIDALEDYDAFLDHEAETSETEYDPYPSSASSFSPLTDDTASYYDAFNVEKEVEFPTEPDLRQPQGEIRKADVIGIRQPDALELWNRKAVVVATPAAKTKDAEPLDWTIDNSYWFFPGDTAFWSALWSKARKMRTSVGAKTATKDKTSTTAKPDKEGDKTKIVTVTGAETTKATMEKATEPARPPPTEVDVPAAASAPQPKEKVDTGVLKQVTMHCQWPQTWADLLPPWFRTQRCVTEDSEQELLETHSYGGVLTWQAIIFFVIVALPFVIACYPTLPMDIYRACSRMMPETRTGWEIWRDEKIIQFWVCVYSAVDWILRLFPFQAVSILRHQLRVEWDSWFAPPPPFPWTTALSALCLAGAIVWLLVILLSVKNHLTYVMTGRFNATTKVLIHVGLYEHMNQDPTLFPRNGMAGDNKLPAALESAARYATNAFDTKRMTVAVREATIEYYLQRRLIAAIRAKRFRPRTTGLQTFLQ